MSKQSKLTRSATYLKAHESLFICPLCESPIQIVDLRSFVCLERHTFDIARQGYIYLLTKPSPTQYDQQLFTARQTVIKESNFFNPLIQKLATLIAKHTTSNRSLTIADMGCGEGSHLHTLCHQLHTETNKQLTCIGLDISKEGIMEAAKNYEGFIWLVSDLAQPPIRNHCLDVIINILSPAHYESFHQLLSRHGLMIKVVPGQYYLQELRTFFHYDADKPYSNVHVVQNFKKHFELIEQINVYEQTPLEQSTLHALVQMTPLTWNADKEKVEQFINSGTNKITLDLKILVGRKKGT